MQYGRLQSFWSTDCNIKHWDRLNQIAIYNILIYKIGISEIVDIIMNQI